MTEANPDLAAMRRRALQASLAAPATLGEAIDRFGFVQADPIRAPARAQDLILRHRVAGYRAGDLERRFARLGLEEDFIYAYGFMPAETKRLLHPRADPDNPDQPHVPAGLAAEVLALVRARGATHPRELEAAFGRDRAVNAWGGFSKTTTQVLHTLQYHGHIRVAHRQDGIRVYEAAPRLPAPLAPDERLRRLVLLVVRILGPVSRVSLRGTFALMRRGVPGLAGADHTVDALLASGALETATVDGEEYIWPAVNGEAGRDAPRRVRFLAPFDPVVWDRRRFEHLWGWIYRFEAYTPARLRKFGYYAMPLLWADRMVGWVNLGLDAGGLRVETGYMGKPPRGRDFARAFDAEVARMEAFLRER